MAIIRLAHIIATLCYVGYFPVAPGTIASFLTIILWWFLPILSTNQHLFLLGLLFFIGVWASTLIERAHEKKDPSCIVIDEMVGMGLSLLFVPKIFSLYFIAFILFRFFDITKIFPINWVERTGKRGWGIMLDDLFAGFMTLAVVHVLLFFEIFQAF